MRTVIFGVITIVLVGVACAASAPSIGDAAPTFQLPGSDGQIYNLSQFVGKQAVVIAWFPKAFTGG